VAGVSPVCFRCNATVRVSSAVYIIPLYRSISLILEPDKAFVLRKMR
jgi:hypothetical protein